MKCQEFINKSLDENKRFIVQDIFIVQFYYAKIDYLEVILFKIGIPNFAVK